MKPLTSMAAPIAGESDFRGKHAPASLKPSAASMTLKRGGNFRGKHAPASLKRESARLSREKMT